MQVIVFTGGGTGGHVYPGLAVVQAMKKREDFRFVWFGSKNGIEKQIVTAFGIEYVGISSGKLRRYLSLQNLTDLFRIVGGYFQSKRLLKKLNPVCVFSKGGFVSVPPVRAARKLGIPVYSHESDFDPGLATKLNLSSTKTLFIPYQESLPHYSESVRPKVVVTGNPVRSEFSNADPSWLRTTYRVERNKKVLLVLGGSLGALQLNQLVEQNLERWKDKYFVVHQTGKNWTAPPSTSSYVSAPYFSDEMPNLYKGADLLIGRAGAGTLWEAARAGLPMVLVPLDSGSRGDQIRNARLFADRGAAVTLEGSVTPERLEREVESLMNDPKRYETMKRSLETFEIDDAASKIADRILSEVRGR